MAEETLRMAADRRGVLIGAAVIPEMIENEKDYHETLAREFNCIVAENMMKFMYLHPERDRYCFDKADQLVTFSRENNMKLRGHTLVWHTQMPDWLKDQPHSKDEALAILKDHVDTVLGHFRGQVVCWDVANEVLADDGTWREDSPWYRMTGKDYLESAFRWAHEADPAAKLYYNDYGMEHPNAKADACYVLMKEFVERGVPVHGVGFQCHQKLENKLDAAACLANLRRFTDLGLDVQFTEMDIWIRNPVTDELRQEQAAEYANRFRVGLEAKASAFVFWGFTDKYSWIPNFTKGLYDEALPFDRDYQPKPAVDAIRKALS